MKHGNTILAFVKDPDGYMIELLMPKQLDNQAASNNINNYETKLGKIASSFAIFDF